MIDDWRLRDEEAMNWILFGLRIVRIVECEKKIKKMYKSLNFFK